MIELRGSRYNGGGHHTFGDFEIYTRLFKECKSWIAGGRSLYIIGGRKLGKSTLLTQLNDSFLDEFNERQSWLFPIYWDLETLERPFTTSRFFKLLADKIDKKIISEIKKTGNENDLPPSVQIDDEDSCYQFIEYIKTNLDHCSKMALNIRLIILLDECETLLKFPQAHNLIANLRSIISKECEFRVQLIITGFRKLNEYTDPETNSSPLKGALDPIFLEPFNKREFDSFIEPLAGTPPDIESGELSEVLWNLTGGHPCLAQVICGYLQSGLSIQKAQLRSIDHHRMREFKVLLSYFNNQDHERFREILDDSCPYHEDKDDFLVYSGFVVKKNNRVSAPCKIFNDWYIDRSNFALAPPATVKHSCPFPDVPQDLITAVTDSELALFVGSGLSLGKDVHGDFPAWSQIPELLLDQCLRLGCANEEEIASRRNLFKNPKSLNNMLSDLDGVKELLGLKYQTALNQIFRPREAKCGTVHRAIEELGMAALLTTNYDQIIEQAGGPPDRTIYTWKEADYALADLKDDRKILLKIHGTAERKNTIILTSSEYGRLENDKSYRNIIQYLFQKFTFLFIGYGLNDPLDLDKRLKGTADVFKNGACTHYALLKQPRAEDQDRLLRDYNIKIISYHDHDEILSFILKLKELRP